MARLGQYETSVSLDIGSSVNAPSRVAPTTIRPIEVPYQETPNYMGQAIEAVGVAGTKLSLDLAKLGEIRRASADTSWFSKARSQASMEWIQTEQRLQETWSPTGPVDPSSPAGGAQAAAGYSAPSFYDAAQAEWGKIRDKYLTGAPSPEAQDAFTQWADEYGVGSDKSGVGVRAYGFERDQLFAQRAGDLNDAMLGHIQLAAAKPELIDDIMQDARADIAANAFWMTPEEEDEAWAKVEKDIQHAAAKSEATFSPLEFKRKIGLGEPTGPDLTAAKIIGAESGGKATADNPKSSALGPGQFIESTWLSMIEKHQPDLWAAYQSGAISKSDLLALRTDEQLSRDMVVALTNDNAKALAAEGFEPTEGNLYLAHFAGVEGAKMVLLATDDTPVTAIFSPAAIRANPVLQGGQTVGGLKAWAAGKMGEAVPADLGSFVDNPHYSRLSPDEIFALASYADSNILEQHRQATVAQQQDYAARLNGLKLGILDGVAGMPDILKARRDGWLNDADDIGTLTNMVATRDKDLIETTRVLAKGADPNYRWNAFADEDKKDGNTLYKAMGGAIGLSSGDEASVARLTDFIDRTDIIPEDAVAALKAGMQSRDQAEMQSAFQVMDGLYRAFPGAVSRPGVFAEDDIKRLLNWRGLMQAGVPVETIKNAMTPNLDPVAAERREKWRDEGQKLALETDPNDVLAIFSGAERPGTRAPLDSSIMQVMMDDYAAAFAEGYAINRDPEQAKKYAIEILTNPNADAWGATDVGDSSGRVMKYPPEYFFNPIHGDHDWMGDQLEDLIRREAGESTIVHPHAGVVTSTGMKAQGWGVTAMPSTEGAVGAGMVPTWMVHYIDENGMFRTIMPPADAEPGWPFTYDPALESDRERRARERPIEIRRNRPDMPTDLPVPGAPGSGDVDYQKALQERLGG